MVISTLRSQDLIGLDYPVTPRFAEGLNSVVEISRFHGRFDSLVRAATDKFVISYAQPDGP